MRDQKLFASILYFPLAEADDFLGKLCHANHWPPVFAHRAIEEYKRFVYLAMVAPMPVTPSSDVDRVWRLHLLYEKSYAAMCALLPRPLPYKPLPGGDWYARTKRYYAAEFGYQPPRHLWTDQPVTSDHIAPEPGWRWPLLAFLGGGATGAAAGTTTGDRLDLWADWLPLAAVVLLLGYLLTAFARALTRGGRNRLV